MLSSAFRLLVFIPIVMYLMRLPGFNINVADWNQRPRLLLR
jgi:hypothetical protein